MEKKVVKKTKPLPSMELPGMPPDRIVADLMGSYTGLPLWRDGIPSEDMVPVQDADDL